jgi:hypothetical protein
MRLKEFKPNVIKPLTPQQQRIKSLQTQKDNVSKTLKAATQMKAFFTGGEI